MSKKRNPSSSALAAEIIKNYKPETIEDMQDALKDIFGPLFEAMLEGELTGHLGYEKHSKDDKSTNNRRNGSSPKTLKTSYGEVEINSPRDREGSFQPELIKKRQTDVSSIENKVLGMYARGMSQKLLTKSLRNLKNGKTGPLTNAIPFCLLTVYSPRSEISMKQRSMPFTPFWATPWKEKKKSWGCGLVKVKAKTAGCRFLMKLSSVA